MEVIKLRVIILFAKVPFSIDHESKHCICYLGYNRESSKNDTFVSAYRFDSALLSNLLRQLRNFITSMSNKCYHIPHSYII